MSFLDRPEFLQVIFPLAYSPFGFADFTEPAPGDVLVYPVTVGEEARIDCAFWVSGKEKPSILFFHGNGETAAGYDWIAPYYRERGINLFVADYRGYGTSTGKPTVSNVLSDAHIIFKYFLAMLEQEGFRRDAFVMGRSLGSMPAIEVAAGHPDEIRGLIVESGAAHNFRNIWTRLGIVSPAAATSEDSPFLNKVKIQLVHRPTLIIHGEYDEIIPVDEGDTLYCNAAAEDKAFIIIPEAGHNDIMVVDPALYFNAIGDFVKTHI